MSEVKCPKCGGKTELEYEGEIYCLTHGCKNSRETYEEQEAKNFKNTFYGTTCYQMAIEWQKRAEKAEAELKTLKGVKE